MWSMRCKTAYVAATQVVGKSRGCPRAYLLPSPTTDRRSQPDQATFRPAVCSRSKVGLGNGMPFSLSCKGQAWGGIGLVTVQHCTSCAACAVATEQLCERAFRFQEVDGHNSLC